MMAELGSADTVVTRASLPGVSVCDSPVLRRIDHKVRTASQPGVLGSWGRGGRESPREVMALEARLWGEWG